MRILKIPYVTEPGSVVYRIKASDADNDDITFGVLEDSGNALIRFEKINQNEANVILMCPLNKNDEYNLTIYANTNGESTYVESRLIATDVDGVPLNQLSPFVIDSDPVYVYENASLNNSIAVIKAIEQENSELPVTFELSPKDDAFHFRYIFGPRGMSVAEIILLRPLDYEKQNLYILTILAINGKTRPDCDTRNVHQLQMSVVVKDVQDTAPLFENLPARAFMEDSYEPNQPIFRIKAQDGDITNKRDLAFNIKKPHDEYFKINSNGELSSSLSYDEINEKFDIREPIVLKIEANEVVTSPRSLPQFSTNEGPTASTSELMMVFKSHNRMPHFSHNQLFSTINEHSPRMTSVQWTTPNSPGIYDPDHGFNGTFELKIIDPTNTFLISPTVGYRNSTFTLLVKNPDTLDFERYHSLNVTIQVTDLSQEIPMTNNVTCTISIEDINDNYPEFSKTRYRRSLAEDAKEGTIVANVEAMDKDTGDYGKVVFTGVKGLYADSFKIDPSSGTVTLVNNENIDREMIEELFLTIEARDNLGTGNINTTELYIQILDANDNPPLFLQKYYLAILRSDPMEFVHPLKVDAIDIDQMNTTNSMVNYEIIHGNYGNLFDIDRTTGKIHIVKRNQDLPMIPYINLTVRAYDLGIPQMSSNAKIYIYVMVQQQQPTELDKNMERIVVNKSYVNIQNLQSSSTNQESSSSSRESNRFSTNHRHEDDLNESFRTIRMASSSSVFNFANLLMWLLIFLILLLLLFLLGLCCYFCCKRNRDHDETIFDFKNAWSLQKNNVVRPSISNSSNQIVETKKNKKHKVILSKEQQVENNKLMSMNDSGHHRQQTLTGESSNYSTTNDWFRNLEKKFTASGEDIEYEIKEEKRYTNTPKIMSYMCKKIIRPKMNETKRVDILNLEENLDDHDDDHDQNRLFQRKKISSAHLESGNKNQFHQLTFDDIESQLQQHKILRNSNEASAGTVVPHESSHRIQFKNLSHSAKQMTNISGKEGGRLRTNVLGNWMGSRNYLTNFVSNCQNMQTKSSIFSLAYNGVRNRENISSESDKTLYEYDN